MTRPPKHASFPDRLPEDTLEFQGLPGDKRNHTDRPHLVPASESEIGGIDHDERGHARWTWKAQIAASADPTAETFDYLKALDVDLKIERRQQGRVPEQSTKTGINPYDTARSKKLK